MLCFICNVIFTNFINNISVIDSVRPNNTIYLLPSALIISFKLCKFAGKIIYFSLPNLICDKISISCVRVFHAISASTILESVYLQYGTNISTVLAGIISTVHISIWQGISTRQMYGTNTLPQPNVRYYIPWARPMYGTNTLPGQCTLLIP